MSFEVDSLSMRSQIAEIDAEALTWTEADIKRFQAQNILNDVATIEQAESLLESDVKELFRAHANVMSGPFGDNRIGMAKMFILEVNNLKHVVSTWDIPDPTDEMNTPIAEQIEELRLMVMLAYTDLKLILQNPLARFSIEEHEAGIANMLTVFHKLLPYVNGLLSKYAPTKSLRREPSDTITDPKAVPLKRSQNVMNNSDLVPEIPPPHCLIDESGRPGKRVRGKRGSCAVTPSASSSKNPAADDDVVMLESQHVQDGGEVD
jgi:hypothetical protein